MEMMIGEQQIETALLATGFTLLVFALLWVCKAVWMLYRWRVREREQANLRSMPESVRAGSDLVTVPPSTYQWLVGVYSVDAKSNKKTYLASGVIIDSKVITCLHAIAEVPKNTIMIRTWDDKYHSVGPWVEVEADLVAADPPQGYKSAKVRPLSTATHVTVICARPTQNSSYGVLTHEREICNGRLSYTGSTIAGFSGGAYFNGQQVVGLHLGGGSQGNYGISASLVCSRLRTLRKPESSEFLALARSLGSAKRSQVFTDYGYDEVRIEVNGRYFELDLDEFQQFLEESRYADLFFEEPESGETERRPRKNWKNRGWENEPDYVPEGALDEQAQAFLGQTPPSASNAGASQRDIVSHVETTNEIHAMRTSMEETIAGLTQELKQLHEVCMSIQKQVNELQQPLSSQIETSVNSCQQHLMLQIESGFGSLRDMIASNSHDTSNPSSTPSTQQVQQASAPSNATPRLAMRWDGMDSDIQMFMEWRNSRNTSHPDYAHWREEYLTSLGLTPEQRKAIIQRCKNMKISLQHKRARNLKHQAMISNSS